MAGFTMKADAPSSNSNGGGFEGKQVDPSEWAAWAEYQFSVWEVEAENSKNRLVKSAPTVGILNMIVDMGNIPQLDGSYDVKAGITSPAVGVEENTPEEVEYMEKFAGRYFKWEKDYKSGTIKRKQFAPRKPEHEIGLYVDFPEIMIDMAKHPFSESTKPDMKPLRVFLNGIFNKVHGAIRTSKRGDGTFPDNMINKIAKASVGEQAFIKSGYDIGIIAGVACKYELELSLSQGEKTFFNTKAKAPSKITPVKAGSVTVSVEDQIPSCDVPFVGILLNGGDYCEENLKFLRKDIKEIMRTGTDFEGSDLNKALEARTEEFMKTLNKEGSNTPTPKKAPPAETKSVPVQEEVWDDDIPF